MKKASKIITGFNKGEYKALIKDLYTEDARLTKQKNRYVTALKQFIELYGDEEVEIYSAPGRSEICGMHTIISMVRCLHVLLTVILLRLLHLQMIMS